MMVLVALYEKQDNLSQLRVPLRASSASSGCSRGPSKCSAVLGIS